jgi:soluble lytic murein transglycosylase-like protein
MRAMLDKYKGNVALALAAYNAGARRVDEAGGIPDIKETRDYVRRIMALYGGQQLNIYAKGDSDLVLLFHKQ